MDRENGVVFRLSLRARNAGRAGGTQRGGRINCRCHGQRVSWRGGLDHIAVKVVMGVASSCCGGAIAHAAILLSPLVLCAVSASAATSGT